MKPVSLALRVGRSFGAFTWGVLHLLLEEDALQFDMGGRPPAGGIMALF